MSTCNLNLRNYDSYHDHVLDSDNPLNLNKYKIKWAYPYMPDLAENDNWRRHSKIMNQEAWMKIVFRWEYAGLLPMPVVYVGSIRPLFHNPARIPLSPLRHSKWRSSNTILHPLSIKIFIYTVVITTLHALSRIFTGSTINGATFQELSRTTINSCLNFIVLRKRTRLSVKGFCCLYRFIKVMSICSKNNFKKYHINYIGL